MKCPKCNAELTGEVTECNVCGWEADPEVQSQWVVLGSVQDRVFADLARETLKSLEIPVVVHSRDGFFGNLGLSLNPFFNRHLPQFTISVPAAWLDDACQALDVTLGDKWSREVN